MIERVKNIFNYLQKDITAETKKRRLLRAACITWFSVLMCFSIKNYVLGNEQTHDELLLNFITVFVIVIIFIVDLKGHNKLANHLITFALTASIITSAFFVLPGRDAEVFLIIIGPFSVFFVRQSFIQILIFSVAFGAFIFLPQLLEIESVIHEIFMLKMVFVVTFIIVKDVDSVNKKTEKSLNKQKIKAEEDKKIIESQKQKLDELDQFKNRFFINIAHELRTPLTLIGGFAAQLPNKNSKDSISDKIVVQSGKMKQIVDDILDLSKLSNNKLILSPRVTNLSSLLEKKHNEFLTSFKLKGIRFDLDMTVENCNSKVDVIYFERAINNILLNSLKFTEQGYVSIKTKCIDNHVEISITDTGIGMEEKELPKILTQFYQIDNDVNKAGGSGIGLSFTNKIIELHDGKLAVESTIGKGTKVTIRIKLEPQNEIVNDTIKTTVIKNNNHLRKHSKFDKKKKILLVEDHPDMRSYLIEVLSDYQVLEAENGAEALTLMEHENVDFVITDYMMPKMNGFEFIKKIKEKGYTLPTLMLTARADVEAKLNMLRLGLDDYMTKPFNAEELLIRISNALSNNEERQTYIASDEYKNEEKTSNEFILILSKFIKENCADSLFGIENLQEEFALSSSSLYRKIKSETGMSPNAFVREVRLQMARELLENKKVKNLKTLAISLGIKNMTYFSKNYKERFGTELRSLFTK